MVLGFSKEFNKFRCRDHASQSTWTTLDVGPVSASKRCSQGMQTRNYLRVASSLRPGHQVPAAIMLSFPGLTIKELSVSVPFFTITNRKHTHSDNRRPVIESVGIFVLISKNLHMICDMILTTNFYSIEIKVLHPAKIPFLPLREKLADIFLLYGVLSLLNLTFERVSIGIKFQEEHSHHGIFGG